MKKPVLVVLWVFVVCGVGFSQNLPPPPPGIPQWPQEVTDALETMQNAKEQAEDFMDSLVKVFPDAATQQNVESRAWIGYLIQKPYPEITKRSGRVTRELPHFTLGLGIGASLFSTAGINDMGKDINGEEIIPIPFLPLPSISADARIGGIKTPRVNLPFDLGFSFFTLNLDSLVGEGSSLQWTNWGLDSRYLVIQQNGAIPAVSANVGFAHWSLNLATDIVDMELSTNTVYFGGQASYTLGGFFIPYLGLKMLTGKNTGIIRVTSDAAEEALSDLLSNPAFNDYTDYVREVTNPSVTSGKPFFNMQFYGGFGIDWLVFETSVGASINVFTGRPGLNFTTRFSL
jgi:hypothetical protein